MTTVVNFGFGAFWADPTLLSVKMCRFFWAEIPGKKAEIPGRRAKIPGQMVIVYFDMGKSTENGQKSNQNLPWKEICNQ